MGNLTNIKALLLNNNQLTGPIPAELGSLVNLRSLYLNDNHLAGAIPPQLGGLANLGWLELSNNELAGAVPAELGDSQPEIPQIDGNPLSGPVPSTLTTLNLDQFWYDETNLGEPDGPAYQTWLGGIVNLKRTNMVCGTHTVNPPCGMIRTATASGTRATRLCRVSRFL